VLGLTSRQGGPAAGAAKSDPATAFYLCTGAAIVSQKSSDRRVARPLQRSCDMTVLNASDPARSALVLSQSIAALAAEPDQEICMDNMSPIKGDLQLIINGHRFRMIGTSAGAPAEEREVLLTASCEHCGATFCQVAFERDLACGNVTKSCSAHRDGESANSRTPHPFVRAAPQWPQAQEVDVNGLLPTLESRAVPQTSRYLQSAREYLLVLAKYRLGLTTVQLAAGMHVPLPIAWAAARRLHRCGLTESRQQVRGNKRYVVSEAGHVALQTGSFVEAHRYGRL